METYFYFNNNGECSLPNQELISQIKSKNEEPLLIMDSSVCLDIVKYIDKKTLPLKDEERIISLFKYLNDSDIGINESWGVLELCHNSNLLTIDKLKFRDYTGRIVYSLQLPIDILISKKFDLIDKVIETEENILGDISVLEPLLVSSYCSLLKIRSLALNGLSKQKAKKNFFNFLQWIDNDLNILMAIECQLAAYIFGGMNAFRKMIWLDNNPAECKQKLWGTAWDILHYRIHCNYSELVKINNIQNRNIFVTKDRTLFKLISKLTLLAAIVTGDKVNKTIIHSNDNYPNFKDDYDEISRFQTDLNLRRVLKMKKFKFNKTKVLKMIEELEKNNNIS